MTIRTAAVLSFCVFLLSPILVSGFIGDDAYNSLIAGSVKEQDITISERYLDEVWGWAVGATRFVPIGWLIYFYYYAIESLLLTKILNLLIILANVLIWRSVLTKIVEEDLGDYFIIFYGVIAVIKTTYDPMIAFSFLLPTSFLLFGLSCIFFIQSIDLGSTKRKALSIALYIASCLTYEVAIFLAPVFFLISLIIFRQRGKGAPRFVSIAYFFVALVFIFGKLLFSWYVFSYLGFDNSYPGATPHFDKQSVIAFIKQSLFTITLPYVVVNYLRSFGLKDLFFQVPVFLISAVFFKVFVSLDWFERKNYINIRRINIPLLMVFGLLIFAPAFMVALSGHKSTVATGWSGTTYLPAYFQYFGFASVCAYCFWISTSVVKIKKIYCSVLFAVCVYSGIVFLSNWHAVKMANLAIGKSSRDFFTEFELPKDVRDADLIIRPARFPHDHYWNYLIKSDGLITKDTICNSLSILSCTALKGFNIKSTFPDHMRFYVGGDKTVVFFDYNHSSFNVRKIVAFDVFRDRVFQIWVAGTSGVSRFVLSRDSSFIEAGTTECTVLSVNGPWWDNVSAEIRAEGAFNVGSDTIFILIGSEKAESVRLSFVARSLGSPSDSFKLRLFNFDEAVLFSSEDEGSVKVESSTFLNSVSGLKLSSSPVLVNGDPRNFSAVISELECELLGEMQ